MISLAQCQFFSVSKYIQAGVHWKLLPAPDLSAGSELPPLCVPADPNHQGPSRALMRCQVGNSRQVFRYLLWLWIKARVEVGRMGRSGRWCVWRRMVEVIQHLEVHRGFVPLNRKPQYTGGPRGKGSSLANHLCLVINPQCSSWSWQDLHVSQATTWPHPLQILPYLPPNSICLLWRTRLNSLKTDTTCRYECDNINQHLKKKKSINLLFTALWLRRSCFMSVAWSFSMWQVHFCCRSEG